MDLFADLGSLTKGVVVHHWDTDGLVSAALLRNYFQQHYPEKKLDLFMPTITNYYLTADQYDYLQQQGYEFVLTCDLNFPVDTVEQLAKQWPGQVYFFDHHHHPQPYEQVHYYNQEHPACASHIAQLLGLPYDLLPVMAMVGDREEAIQADRQFYPAVQAVLSDHALTFAQLLEARRLIDSNYIMDDYTGIVETIQLLQDDPLAVFTDVRLQTNLRTIDSEITQLVERPAEQFSDQVWFWEITTHYNLLSHITRALSRHYPNKVIFTRQLKHDQVTCYVRRKHHPLDVRTVIAYAHELGLNSGGKPEVAGIIIPEYKLTELFPQIKAKLIALAQS